MPHIKDKGNIVDSTSYSWYSGDFSLDHIIHIKERSSGRHDNLLSVSRKVGSVNGEILYKNTLDFRVRLTVNLQS